MNKDRAKISLCLDGHDLHDLGFYLGGWPSVLGYKMENDDGVNRVLKQIDAEIKAFSMKIKQKIDLLKEPRERLKACDLSENPAKIILAKDYLFLSDKLKRWMGGSMFEDYRWPVTVERVINDINEEIDRHESELKERVDSLKSLKAKIKKNLKEIEDRPILFPKSYERRPQKIEAVKIDLADRAQREALKDWSGGLYFYTPEDDKMIFVPKTDHGLMGTTEGDWVDVKDGDYLVKFESGLFGLYSNEVFNRHFKEAK